jgi:phage terminase large subunit GpA-like protein
MGLGDMLQAQRDAEDAKRYRWLRDHCDSQFRPVARVPCDYDENTDYEIQWFGKMAGEYLDKFIDEAIARSTREPEGQ